MSKKIKTLELDSLRKSLGKTRDYVLVEPLKVDAATDHEVRKKLRDQKVSMHMVKNSYAKKIFSELGITVEKWGGPTLLCWGGANIKALSNAVDSVLKESKKDPKSPDKFKIKTAVADGQPVTIEIAKTLPTREEAIGDILGGLLGPGSSIAGALSGPATQLAGILKTIEEKTPAEAPAAAS